MMCDRGTSTVVDTPDWLWGFRAIPERGIHIDACIADTVLAAWAAGVRTLGSCCGHGDRPPSLVLTQDVEQPHLARRVLADLDARPFTLYQWQLTDVSKEEYP